MFEWLKDILISIRSFFRAVLIGFSNFWVYKGIIWKDRDWDFAYLLYLVEFKLGILEKAVREDSWHTETEKRANQVLVCKNLVKRISEDDYCSKEWGDVFATYDDPMDMLSDHSHEKIKITGEIWEKSDELRKQDEQLLAKLIIKHYRGWWT